MVGYFDLEFETLICSLFQHIQLQFNEEPGPAVLLLIYSTVLSRGIDR